MEQNIIIKIFKQLLDGLKYLHSKNIIHRDIRLDNILLDKNQNLKITNFLIFAFYRDKKKESPQNKDSNLHSNSIRKGRPDFISPEILKGIEYDAKTDIYSLGLIMLCLMSKTFPIIMRKKEESKKIYREINSNNIWDIYNKSLKNLVLKMINEDKLLRPSSEEAYKELLEIEKLIKIHNIKDLEAIGTKLIDFEEIPKDKNCKYSILKCNDRKYFEIMSSKKTKINYLIKKMNKNGKYFSMTDFKRETGIMKDLNHENIIKYYGFFEDKEEMKKYNEIHKDNKEKKNDIEIYCLVFEYDPSFIFLEDYYNKYKKNFSDEKDFKPLDEDIILNIFKQLVEGLKYLQKKRRLEYPNLIQNNQISFQKEINFCIEKTDILNSNNIQNNECLPKEDGNFEFFSKLIIPKLKNDNNSNLNEIESNNSSINISNTDKDNKHESNKNININNLVYNIDENPYVDCSNLKNINEKIKENINENINENNNSIDSTNSQIQYNNTALKKNNFFNVIHPKNQNYKKKITKKYINQGENNNEIKVLKNNKVVYVNTYLLNSYSTSKNIKKLNKIAFIGRNKRSSKYRGVSKNGNQWQVLMMLNKNKSYIGSYPSEELAARIYDILAIKNRGIKARTNFIYNSKQLKRICEIDIDIKSKNISEIISQLTN